ncbi:DUF885 domain-containing protein [Nakamurella flavida]|uniref:DUF885 domain-containing protein n=1 Tax=Nakamurella flavida TaxID=363630 RepID=A0A938YRW7_9ACTN|nr:DUF885 domain-containing protein [Nakamurella flavida]MBM9478339.1 DUF885 domain-containing protein [Nakamurella flavida]MDP9777489.1 uncharacterized protein (DUF885 family) [Nakamurella flavida]
MRTQTAVDRISDDHVRAVAATSPVTALYLGYPAGPGLDDLSPEGLDRRHDVVRETLTALRLTTPAGEGEELAREVIEERLTAESDQFASGWQHADLNVIESPLQRVRTAFDLMPRGTDDELSAVAGRLRAVPDTLAGYRMSLLHAADQGRVAAVRQIVRCARQCGVTAGSGDAAGHFSGLVRFDRDDVLGRDVAAAVDSAHAAFASFGTFLRDELAPRAPIEDAVGRERYERGSRDHLGAVLPLEETYAWGWAEFLGIERELRTVAARIGGGGPATAAAVLDADPRHQVHGQDGLQRWLQDLSERSIDELGRTHFTIADPIRRLDCRIAPPGGPIGAYYLGPSDDFSRPGSMWWSVDPGREVFSTWREATVVHHESVPGHHFQIATAVHSRDRLNDFRRLLAGPSAYTEGWALYAERLVRELGYLDDDGDLLGMLDEQLFRAARVVVDIGMHLRLRIPADTGFHEGERWTPELGLQFLTTRTLADPARCRDEIDRYLGWPGQAPAYKVGERVWLAGREAARRRQGGAFDLKTFHTAALQLGGMGLDPLARTLARLPSAVGR